MKEETMLQFFNLVMTITKTKTFLSMKNKFSKIADLKGYREDFDKDVKVTMERLRSERNTNYELYSSNDKQSLLQPKISDKKADFQLNQVLGEISSSSDDEAPDSKDQAKQESEFDFLLNSNSIKDLSEKYDSLMLIDIVEIYENKNNQAQNKNKQTCNEFRTSREFDIPNEDKKLLEYIPLDKISQKIYNTLNEGSDGLPVCVQQYCNFLYIGFTQGSIKMYDLNTMEGCKEFLPKKRKSTGYKVTCLDVSLSGDKIVAGYASGKFCLFDVQKQKIIIEKDEEYKTEIISIKFLSKLSSNHFIITDKYGNVKKAVLTKGIIKNSCIIENILEKPVAEICMISSLLPKVGMPYEVVEWEALNLVAISSTEQFGIYVLGESFNILYGINRFGFGKDFIRSNSNCYLDWGFGVTPNSTQDKPKCLLAIAWDKLLQICVLEDPNKGMSGFKMDGYYISDYSIDKVCFISESVIIIIVNK